MNKKYIKLLYGIGIGSILGFGYYYFIGCASGTCAITSNPFISTAYGALMGLVFVWPEKVSKEQAVAEGNTDEK